MANEEHLAILKRGGMEWNGWRLANPRVVPSLGGADLANSRLDSTNLIGANLAGAKLLRASLREASLSDADLTGADLTGADLCGASLVRTVLSFAKLRGTLLAGAALSHAVLNDTDISAADLSGVQTLGVIFAGVDLSTAKGLDTVVHRGPSTIGIDTINKSKGQISYTFLHGCGLNDADIEYAKLAGPGLSNAEISDITYRIYHLKATQAVQTSPLFISYSHDDSTFVDSMEKHLNDKGIRFWRDTHDATAGRLEKQIDRAIRLNTTVLLILSEHSVNSDWVEHEAASARELEKELKRDVLCPIALDGSWKDCDWPMVLRRQIMDYNILDFSKWQDEAFFASQFNKLIAGLHIFYQDEKPKD